MSFIEKALDIGWFHYSSYPLWKTLEFRKTKEKWPKYPWKNYCELNTFHRFPWKKLKADRPHTRYYLHTPLITDTQTNTFDWSWLLLICNQSLLFALTDRQLRGSIKIESNPCRPEGHLKCNTWSTLLFCLNRTARRVHFLCPFSILEMGSVREASQKEG